MSRRSTKPPFLVEKKFENRGNIFTVKSPDVQERVPSYHLLHHDRDAKKKSGEKFPFKGAFLYASLLRMVRGCPHPLSSLASRQSFIQCPLRIALCMTSVQLLCERHASTYFGGNSKRKRDSSSYQNIQRDEGPSGSKPKLKIIRSQKPLSSPVLETADNTLQTKILRVGVAISVTPISEIPIQSIVTPAKAPERDRLTPEPSLAIAYRQKLKSIVVCAPNEQGISNVQGSKLNYGKTIFLPPDGAKNIMDNMDWDPIPTECMGESSDMNFKEKLAYVPLPSGSHYFPLIQHLSSLGKDFLGSDLYLDNSNSICIPNNDDEVESTPEANAARGKFDNLYDLINEIEGDATPLKRKVERLIHQVCGLKDLQESHSNRMTTKVRESCLIEVRSKLNGASHQLDAESTRYNALKTKVKQVDLRREDLSCQVVASRDLLQEVERTFIDLKGQINTLTVTEVIDPATKVSLEKTEVYVK
ncbi:hypothetical protein Cgig2_013422 [Carnegiea gigantea]|uniref:Uncharacterized protein n=1 Tax=Carnegiea gigantea TaxID=171969 RepID=A0A9Q1JVB0_9CARY|nr:hypothetical protein Cgig2_013422 [Carnegiea gigantea]